MTTTAQVTPDNSGASSYTAHDIVVLEGLEHVRLRPGMYIGSTGVSGLHHLVWEVLDNSVDEAMAGTCTEIDVTILKDGGCRIRDNGRGIPVDPHPSDPSLSAVEVAMTKLNAGGKFGSGSYKVSGGLHGVGVSVVNALSKRMVAEIERDGASWVVEFSDGGKIAKPLTKVGPSDGHGTTVTFWPDETIFETVEFSTERIMERLQTTAFLNRGLTVRFRDERSTSPGRTKTHVWRYDGGVVDFAKHLNDPKGKLFAKVLDITGSDETSEVEIAVAWNETYYETLAAFANGVATVDGGTHVEGFRKALTQAINRYAKTKGLIRDRDVKDTALSGDDVREGLTAVISVKLTNPQFEGQTKAKLGNTSVRSLVERVATERIGEWLDANPREASAIVKKAVTAARARIEARKAREVTRRSSALDSGGLPSKLTDCTSKNPVECELFIVEGNSAGGTTIKGRDPKTQAVLPIRGKILNVERATMSKILGNEEIQSLITAIGAGVGSSFDISKVRYHKIIILADADPDGSHIRTLLLTLFLRQMRPLVEAGMVYAAQPPLYSTLLGNDKVYIKNEAERLRFLEQHPNHKKPFLRLKGLGEMDFDELRQTTLDPAQRTLLQITMEDAVRADEVCSVLMGDDVQERRQFIQENAGDARFLDF